MLVKTERDRQAVRLLRFLGSAVKRSGGPVSLAPVAIQEVTRAPDEKAALGGIQRLLEGRYVTSEEEAAKGEGARRLMLTEAGWQALSDLSVPPPDWDKPPDPTGLIHFYP